MNDKERGIKERGIPKSKHDNHLGGFRFGDPSVPVPGSRKQGQLGPLAPVDTGSKRHNDQTEGDELNGVLEMHS